MVGVHGKSLFFHVMASSNTKRYFERVLKVFWLPVGGLEFQKFRRFFLGSVKRIIGAVEGVYCFALYEISKFVHINPDTGGGNVIIGGNILKTFSPEFLGVRSVEIREIDKSRPHTTDQRFSVMLVGFNIDIEFLTSGTRSIWNSDSCIDNGNPSDSEFITLVI